MGSEGASGRGKPSRWNRGAGIPGWHVLPTAALRPHTPAAEPLTWPVGSGQCQSACGSRGLARGPGRAGSQGGAPRHWPCRRASAPPPSAQGSREPGETLPRKLKQVLQREFWPAFESLLARGKEVGWPLGILSPSLPREGQGGTGEPVRQASRPAPSPSPAPSRAPSRAPRKGGPRSELCWGLLAPLRPVVFS